MGSKQTEKSEHRTSPNGEQASGGTQISLHDQAALDLHTIMLQAMRSRESEILRFLGFLLPALAGFFAVGWLKGGEGAVSIGILLPGISMVTVLILFFGAWYALALSYNYRNIHLVTYRLQRQLRVDLFQPKWEPSRFERPPKKPRYKWWDYQLFGFAPEILRTQLLLFLALIFAVAFAFTCAGININPPLHWLSYITVWAAVAFALIFIRWLGYTFYPSKYHKYLEEVMKGVKGSSEDTAETTSGTEEARA